MNKYKHYVYVIPEDDANRQIANGFVRHDRVRDERILVESPAGGWSNVLKKFRNESVPRLRDYPDAHVIMLIDFDGNVEGRRVHFEQGIPAEFKSRVFVLGSRNTPERLRNEANKNFEAIGNALANDCGAGVEGFWTHEQLSHNESDRQRLVETVRPFLFDPVVQA